MPRSLIGSLLMPSEGFYETPLPQLEERPVRTFLPTGYEHNYAYPLIVMFHATGGSDEQVLRYAPRISRRNHVAVSLRGPEVLAGRDDDGLKAFGWAGASDAWLAEYTVKAIQETRKNYHIHTERIYLMGVHDGAAVAYRLAMARPELFAGVVAINGALPRPAEGPLFPKDNVGNLRVLIAHGAANEVIPLETARRDFLALHTAGADVTLNTYPTTHQLHADTLHDVNRWMVRNIDADNCYDCGDADAEDDDDAVVS